MRTNEYDELIKKLVVELKCPFSWLLIKAQMIRESGGNPKAKSSAGAIGLMQLMPSTIAIYQCENPEDPEQNLKVGIQYMTYLFSQFRKEAPCERWKFALGAYNAGIGNILMAQKACQAKKTIANVWDYVAQELRNFTGKNATQTINYVKSIQDILIELLISDNSDDVGV
ncbi:MAG: transglycosylase SLT domain-containing protein [bacterium]